MQLVDTVELKLDVQRVCPTGRRGPHVTAAVRVLALRVQAGPVDQILRPRSRVRNAVARRHHARNRISQRLHRQAPNIALEDRVVRRRIHLIHAPVIGLPKRQPARIKSRATLPLTDQHIPRISPARRIDILE